jgi:dihydrofolate synthase/folylpolyglutamate synthase
MFEATTALALDHFAREAVDVAVLEVGLGGRLDATTVGRPAATVLSRIDLDHEAYLGRTVREIAGEKAAIIRSGVALSAAQAPEATEVIVRRAEQAGVPLLLEGRDLEVTVQAQSLDGQRISCAGPGFRLTDLALPMLGTFQPVNALLAVATAHALGAGERAIRAGVARAHWPGRFEIVRRDPFVVLDGAHNPAGARALAVSLDDLRPYLAGAGVDPLTLVTASMRDKDVDGVIAGLAGAAALRDATVIATSVDLPRALPADALADRWRTLAPAVGRITSIDAPLAALGAALEAPGCTVVAGSLYLVGAVRAHLVDDPDLRDPPPPAAR